jgi:APA family basic amino acid/polyamine antiporter
MARRRDLPTGLSHLALDNPKPVRAELTVAIVAVVIIVAFDIRNAIGISGVGVLVYYAITNWSALRLPLSNFQRIQGFTGLVGCSILVVCLPGWAVLTGTAMLIVGLLVRVFRRSSYTQGDY